MVPVSYTHLKYAYEAGLRALQDHAAERGIPAKAEETRHVGFYRLQYTEVLQERPEVAAVGGKMCIRDRDRGVPGGRRIPGSVAGSL